MVAALFSLHGASGKLPLAFICYRFYCLLDGRFSNIIAIFVLFASDVSTSSVWRKVHKRSRELRSSSVDLFFFHRQKDGSDSSCMSQRRLCILFVIQYHLAFKMNLILPAILFSVGSAFIPPPQGRSSSPLKVASDLFIDETRASVSKYYGEELKSSDDLKTNACCTAGSPPKYIQECISNINPEVVSKYYGCGLCLPQYPLEGASVLDLGCGAGRDVYIASQLVGPTGNVVGVDMTDEQLEVANKHLDYHAEKFGFANVEFKKGYLEQLADLNLEPGSFDVIISNCVINLCTDKEAVLSECLNLLKPGGELYFSDVYANRRVPKVLQDDEVLWGECLSGAVSQYEEEDKLFFQRESHVSDALFSSILLVVLDRF